MRACYTERHTAFSSLRFEPVERVEWELVCSVQTADDRTVDLL